MPQHSQGFGQWFADFQINNGNVTDSPWFASDNVSMPIAAVPAPAPGQPATTTVTGHAEVTPASARFTTNLTPDINSGLAVTNPTPAVMASGASLITSSTSFSGGSATATDASDLNALITAADSQTTAGTLTIDISGSIALNTLGTVANGQSLSWSGSHASIVDLTAVPDIAAINLHSGVSLVINGSNNAILDGGATGTNAVRGLFAYAGNVTVNNLTIQNTVAQGGAGGNSAFGGGGGAGLGGGLFVGAGANVTLNSVSFSGNKAIGGAGGDNTGGSPSSGWAGGGGLGGNGGITDGGSYFSGGGGVGRTAFGADGDYKAVTNYSNTDDRSLPGPGIIVGGASGGHGAPLSYSHGGSPATNSPRTAGAINGGGGGMAQGTNGNGPPFFGGGAGGGGVGGHAGYSYAAAYDSKHITGGGGVGGFGGGGGGGYYYGANGGFGGGGGAGQYKYGGNGGFGGGGGGLPDTKPGSPGLGKYALGGFGAGNAGGGYNIGNYGKLNNGSPANTYHLDGGDSGGGGLGAGGAVFVQSGGVLTLGGAGTVNAGTVTGGAGGVPTLEGVTITAKSQVVNGTEENGYNTNGTAGSAYGNDIFIQNNSTSVAQGITFAPGSGQLLTLTGVIADEQGSGGTGANATQGKVVVQGGGTTKLTGSNTFEGGISVSNSSTLDLGASGAAGSGTITLITGSNRLILESSAEPNGTKFSNSVSGFVSGDIIDLSGLTFHAGATAQIVSNTLTVVSNGVTDTVAMPGAGSVALVALQDSGSGTMAEIHSAPTVVAGATATFTGGGAAVTADAGLTVTDPSSSTLVSAQVVIASGLLSTDTLTVGTAGGLTTSYNSSTGTLTLSGTATVATYQTALESVTFGENPSNSDPTSGSRTLDWTVNDGIAGSTTATSTVNTSHVAGTVTAGASATFSGGGSPVFLDAGLTVSDADSGGKLVGATVKITSGLFSGDTLNFSTQNGISGSYSSGTLTLTGTATLAQYQTALDSITYSFSPSNGDPTNKDTDTSRTISWTINDGAVSSAAATSTLTDVHVAPTVVAGATAAFNGGGAAVVLDSGLAVTDVDSGGVLSSATVTIASPITGDTLNFTNTNSTTEGNVAVGSDSGGVLVLTSSGSTATLAQWQTALESVTYSFTPTNGDPTGGGGHTTRTIDWSVFDGTLNSGTVTSTLDTNHVAPSVTAGATVAYTGGGSPVVLDPGLTASDPDSGGNLIGATVTIGAGFASGDQLNFTTQNGISGSLNNGTLTLTGTASIANYQTALESITYSFSGADPTVGGTNNDRVIDWRVTDGVGTSVASLSTVTVSVHNPPTVVAGGTVTFNGGGAAVDADSGLTVTDPSSGTLVSAMVVVGGFISGDTLTVGTPGGLGTAYSNGTLTLTGTASLATYQTALESVHYGFSAGGDPTGGGGDTSRTLSWIVNDGSVVSNTGTSTVKTVHTAPTVTAGGTVTFDGGGGAVALDPGLTATDVDSGGVLASATVTVAGAIAGDTLNFTNSNPATEGNVAVSSDSGGVLVLTSSGTTATVAQWQTALESVTYSFTPTNGDPTNGGGDTSRTIDWTVNDGVANSGTTTSSLETVHVAPTVTASGTVSYVSAGSPVVLDASVTASDPDSGGDLTGATVKIGTGFASGDQLNFTNQNGIIGSLNNGTLTLSGTATIAQYDTALASITYSFSGGDATISGTDDSRAIDWSVTDGVGTSITALSTVAVSTTPGAPVITAGGTVTFDGGGAAVTADSGLTVSDGSSSILISATVAIGGFISGDTLTVGTPGVLTTSFSSGTLTLTGTSTVAAYQTALDSVTYGFSPANGDPTGGGSHTSRTLSWSVNDGRQVSNTGTSTVDTVHIAPTVTAGATVDYTGGGSPVVLDSGLTVSDPDSGGTLAGAVVTIVSGFAGGDTLSFTNQNGINGSYSAGTLTLTGSASLANYQTALESVTYSFSPGTDPTLGGVDDSRSINWSLNDGVVLSAGASSTVDVAAATGTPSISAPATATVGVGKAGSVGTVTIAESPTTGGETFTLVLSDTHGTLSANTGAVGGGGTVSAPGTSLTISGSLAQVNADLTTLTDDDTTTPSDTISLTLSDSNGGAATPESIAVTVNGLPSISAPASATVAQNVATAVTPVSVAESGNTTTSGESFTVTLTDTAGVLAANTSAPGGGGTVSPSGTALTISGTLAQINADLTTLTDDDASTSSDTISVSVSDSFGNSASAKTIPVTVTPAGQTYNLTTGPDIINGGGGANTINALTNTLSSGDQINGGGGGDNTLNLIGAGLFNLSAPTSLTGVQIVDAQEGQAASPGQPAANQVITLRSGLNVTLNVSAATLNGSNPKPPTITVNGANDSSIINLAGGNDIVTIGSPTETLNGGTGNDQIQVTAATIGANINGGSGNSTLDMLGGGSIAMGSNVTNVKTVVLATATSAMSFIANGISGLTVDDLNHTADTVSAGGTNQTLTGGAGGMIFNGYTGGSTTFSDTASAFNLDAINNFLASGDVIDVTNINPSAAGFGFNPVQNGSSVTLNLTDGTHTTAITVNGSFNVTNFTPSADSGTGTLIRYNPSSG